MLILLTVLFFILTLVLLFTKKVNSMEICWFGTIFVCFFISSILLGVYITKENEINDKIAICIEENDSIKTEMQALVELYIDDMPNQTNMNAEEIVDRWINTYTHNNEKINTLNAGKAGLNFAKWWLYFGR